MGHCASHIGSCNMTSPFFQVLLSALLLGGVLASPLPDNRPRYHDDDHKEPAKPYTFNYGVQDDYSGANYGHSEVSDGQAIEGTYKVVLPDGRTQIVTYIADHHNGFQAQVTYEGEAKYPEEKSYKAKQLDHSPSYRHDDNQYRASAPQPSYQELPEETPIYHPNDENI